MIILLIDDTAGLDDDSIRGIPIAITNEVDTRHSEMILRTCDELWFTCHTSSEEVIDVLRRIATDPEDGYVAILRPSTFCDPTFLPAFREFVKELHGGRLSCALCIDLCWHKDPTAFGPDGKPCIEHGRSGCDCGTRWLKHLAGRSSPFANCVCGLTSNPKFHSDMTKGEYGTLRMYDKIPSPDDGGRHNFHRLVEWILRRGTEDVR